MRQLTILILIFAVAAAVCAIVAPFAAGRADDGEFSPIFGVNIPAGYRPSEMTGATWAPLETIAKNKSATQHMTTAALQLPNEGELPTLGGATEWLNSQPLTAASLRGKVVVVEFWTYTCINWLRTLPYVRAW